MTTRQILTALLLCISAASATHAQDVPPKEPCYMPDSDSAPYTLEELNGSQPAILYDVCKFATVCLKSRMEAGRPIEVFRAQDGWSCGYYASSTGAGPTWVFTAAIRPVTFSPNPPPSAWVGAWQGGEDHVIIRVSSESGKLTIKGTAQWHGNADVVHFGDITGEATPQGNKLHVVEDSNNAQSCTVDLTLYGRYIIAADNDRCGGMNVRFQGIWRRAPTSRNKEQH
jgi:hypothetical protein